MRLVAGELRFGKGKRALQPLGCSTSPRGLEGFLSRSRLRPFLPRHLQPNPDHTCQDQIGQISRHPSKRQKPEGLGCPGEKKKKGSP